MDSNSRAGIQAIIKHYQDCQLNGIKDIDRQMEIYSEESQFTVFPAIGVVGVSEPQIFNGKQAIRELFEKYNSKAKACESVTIVNKNDMIDPEALRGSFVMKITMTKADESHSFFNYLQMQFNHDMQVISSLNWHADVTKSPLLNKL